MLAGGRNADLSLHQPTVLFAGIHNPQFGKAPARVTALLAGCRTEAFYPDTVRGGIGDGDQGRVVGTQRVRELANAAPVFRAGKRAC